MHLENITLINFKNYLQEEVKFSEKINCFVGNNGVGKTNMLDAIHYHTKEEYPYLLQNPVDSHITAIYASNMNDQYAVQVMYSTKALQDTEVNQKVEALANHLNAIPPSTELTNTAKS